MHIPCSLFQPGNDSRKGERVRLPTLSPWEIVKRLVVLPLVLLLSLNLSVLAQEEDEDWEVFSFDTSSESWKRKGETALDLRSGQHVTSGYTRTHGGDFIKMMGFNPSWVTFRTMDWIKILFSTGEANDSKVDEKAKQLPDCVAIHYGDSYVLAFDDHTYTIKLLEGHFEVGGSFARFSYRAGGTPGPEHEPRNPSARQRTVRTRPEASSSSATDVTTEPKKGRFQVRSRATDSIDFSGTGRPSGSGGFAPDDEEEPIDTVTVTVNLPAPADKDSPKRDDLTLSLAARFGVGSYVTRNQIIMAQEGDMKICTFEDVRPGIYKLKAIFKNEAITETVSIDDSNTEIKLAFPGAEEQESQEQEPDDAGDNAPSIDRSKRFRYRTPNSAERASGWIHNLNVIVTAPSADYSGIEEADLKVEIDGPAPFYSIYNKTRAGRTRIFTFRNIPAGEYDIEVIYGDEIITDFVAIEEEAGKDIIETEVTFE